LPARGPDRIVQAMIDLHYWPTPNGFKVSIFLEEAGLPYTLFPVNIGKGEQFRPEFLAISPNNRMPAIVDHDPPGGGAPISIFESGAILLYLAEKTGQFLPADLRGRYEVMQWLMWQMGGVGPMAGQAHHFRMYAPDPIPYAIDRYTKEVNRLYGVLDRRLADREFVAGAYSIADMAIFPWTLGWERQGQKLEDFPNMQRWYEALKARPAVSRGIDVGKELRTTGPMDDAAKKVLFGQTAASVTGTSK
jgi:GST-like protein